MNDNEASWSPNGAQIAVVRLVNPEGTTDPEDLTNEVWLMNPDGSDLRQLTPTNLNFTVHEVSWSNW